MTVPGAGRASGILPRRLHGQGGAAVVAANDAAPTNGGSRWQDLPIPNSSFCPRLRSAKIAGVGLPANVKGEAARKVVDKLIRAGLLEEVHAGDTSVRRTTGTAPDAMTSASTCPGPTEGNWSMSPTIWLHRSRRNCAYRRDRGPTRTSGCARCRAAPGRGRSSSKTMPVEPSSSPMALPRLLALSDTQLSAIMGLRRPYSRPIDPRSWSWSRRTSNVSRRSATASCIEPARGHGRVSARAAL